MRIGQTFMTGGVGRRCTLLVAVGLLAGALATPAAAQSDQTHKLTAADPAAYDFFGDSVSISGYVAIVGASRDYGPGQNSGSAYLFEATTGTQLFRLTPADAGFSDVFGSSVSISGNTAIIGAPGDDDLVVLHKLRSGSGVGTEETPAEGEVVCPL